MFYQNSLRKAIWLICLWFQHAQGADILAFVPYHMKSHILIFHPVVRELAQRGHQVTFYTPYPIQGPVPRTLRQVATPVVSSDVIKKVNPGLINFSQLSAPFMSRCFMRWIHTILDATLGDPIIQELIHSNDTYDLVLHEGIFFAEPSVALQHKFGAYGVTLMPMADNIWVHEMSGLTNNPAYMVDFTSDMTDRMSFLQRLRNVYHLTASLLVYYGYQYYHQRLVDKYFNYVGSEDRPSITQLISDQALILVNSHHSIGYNYPRAPHVKEVGGLNFHKPKPLPNELQRILDDAEGVVYLSLGSNVNMTAEFPKSSIDAFIKVFSTLKEQVLWKWAGEDYPAVSNNVHVLNWFPQQDVLAHKNVKLYIMHGGQSSSIEAVNYALPVIGIPFFADQKKNMRRISAAGFGLTLEHDNITESSLSWAINEVLNNKRYKQKAIRSQQIFQDRPMKPVEEAVYWIEYVLKYGNILQPASVHIPLYQLLLLDVFAVIAAAMFSILFVTIKLFRRFKTRTGKLEKIKQK